MQAFDAFSRTENEYRVRTKSGAVRTTQPASIPSGCQWRSSLLPPPPPPTLSSLASYNRPRWRFPSTIADNSVQDSQLVSLAAILFMTFLFFTELVIYLNTEIQPSLYVDTSLVISVNVMDKAGNHQLNVHDHIYLTRYSSDGKPLATAEKEEVGEDYHAPDIDLSQPDNVDVEECGNCYGAETPSLPCCTTCEDVQEAYRRKGWAFTSPQKIKQCIEEGYTKHLTEQVGESCNVKGYAKVNRVAGNLNIVPGKFLLKNSRYVLDTQLFDFDGAFNISHTINHLSFGLDYPGMVHPLDGKTNIWTEEEGKDQSSMFEYFVKALIATVVPTTYETHDGSVISTNQFSVTEYKQGVELHGQSGVPGFFIMYDLSPIMVHYQPIQKSFLHFITNLCAIIGGVFTVASLIDSFVYSGYRTLKKKLELGKQF